MSEGATQTTTTTRELLAALPARLPPPEIDPDLLDVESLKVVARLKRHGYEAYLVGGCVRDLLCGVAPKDYDVATSATPEQIRDVFRNSRLIGRRFRLAHVYFPNGTVIEVATFRANPAPPEPEADTDTDTDEEDDDEAEVEEVEEVEPVDLLVTDDNQFGTAQEDAVRRDFTVNGLFYDPAQGSILDFVGGREDLERRQIRTIGPAEIRMQEDPVRSLRAARIAAKLNFEIERSTFDAMVHHAGELPRCAPARVLEEMLKLLRSGASREAFSILREATVLRVLLPSIEKVLTRGGEATQQAFFSRLGALDELLREGVAVSDAVMLATLLSFLPLRHDEEGDEGPGFDEEPEQTPHLLPTSDKVLAQMSAHARLPRRIADRVRAVLGAQPHFLTAPKKKKRRRRGGGAGFVRMPHFAEALLLFEIHVRSTGEHQDELAAWKLKVKEALAPKEDKPPVEEKPAEEAAAEATPAKKKRRRGGRRHRKKDESAAPAPDEPAS